LSPEDSPATRPIVSGRSEATEPLIDPRMERVTREPWRDKARAEGP
jgi:hypothetical protein